MNKENLPYRHCVGVVLFNDQGRVFVGERIDTPNAWQMPQGGIEKGEDLHLAALRELKEEIGTDKAELLCIYEKTICYDLPDHLIDTFWHGKYRGQEQHWIAMRFTGQDSDIALDADDHPEFSQWQWVALKDTLDLIVPFKKDVYTEVINAFEDITTAHTS
jgi:putative (di)nucleoside polyphosphate hydrolase